jgi:hypothetical protein
MKYLSALLTQASGKLGGAVAAKNRGGNYFRAKVAPVQPRTTAQQEVRASLAALSAMWRVLSPTNIAGWNALATSVTLHDSLGNAYNPSGAQLFVSCNRNIASIAESVVEAPPGSKPDIPDITPLTLEGAVGTPTLVATPGAVAAPTGYVFLVKATPMYSPGISFVGKSQYRILEPLPASDYAALNIRAPYEDRFGTLIAGQKVSVEISLVSITTGFQGTPATATTNISA